jgi:hypothetical protein
MTYLAFKEFEIGNVDKGRVGVLKDSYPLLSYAAWFWYQHICSADEARGGREETVNRPQRSKLATLDKCNIRRPWKPNPLSLCEIGIWYDIDWLANM